MAERGLAFMQQGLTEENRGSAFGAAVSVPDDASAYDRLVAFGTESAPEWGALVEAARPMAVTFHRAFDLTQDRDQALEALMHAHSPDVTTTTCQNIVTAGYQIGDRVVRPARVTVVEPAPRLMGRQLDDTSLQIRRIGLKPVMLKHLTPPVWAYGGSVDAQSDGPGRGSVFTVTPSSSLQAATASVATGSRRRRERRME